MSDSAPEATEKDLRLIDVTEEIKNVNSPESGTPLKSPITPSPATLKPNKLKMKTEKIILIEKITLSMKKEEIPLNGLFLAAKSNDTKKLKALIESKEDPNLEDEDNWTPLHWAVKYRNIEAVELLIEAKTKPNEKNDYGQSPLHLAVEKQGGSYEIAKKLLEAGADPNLRDKAHITPYEITILEKNIPMINLLRKSNADPGTFKRRVLPVNSSIRAMRVMNRARAKLQVSYKDSSGRVTKLELGPGNAERIPVNCEIVMRPKGQAKKENPDDNSEIDFKFLKSDRRVLICNLKSPIITGMQCMVYVTPKDHPSSLFCRKLNLIHPVSMQSRRVIMSSEAKKLASFQQEHDVQVELRMICFGSWGPTESPESEAHRLFLKYALHQQGGKNSFKSNTMKSKKDIPQSSE